ncbi:hypothetical protein [Apilactobacillus timberlakei]|uniref:hypothetical protein n=2 Tax=Apilactobacillus timberlakei TaxID=2008380 RepID=UPI001127A442|nr:hypothetical protein [Apilactobacillus timberlakei]TPR21940.1 hypothetical protein DY061_01835 [Apilactobacillus timberlakei]TPR22341.1 hypothetical protein DY083_04610 [Apilactobacillus timberlakei]
MFDFENMLKKSIANFRLSEQKGNFTVNKNNRLQKAYINLDISLSRLAKDSKRFSILSNPNVNIDIMDYKNTMIKDFTKSMNLFFLVANLKNWNHLIIISENEQKKLFKNKADNEFSNVYLVIKKMMINSLFNHSEQDFTYAWRIFNKFGIVDMNLNIDEVSKEFFDKN